MTTSRKKLAAVLLAAFLTVLIIQGTVLADGEDNWQNLMPDKVDESTGAVQIEERGLADMTRLILKVVQWLFGISAAVLGLIVLFIGIQIAMSSANVKERAELGTRLGRLVIGAALSFGAWFLVSVIRGFFFTG